MIWQFRPSDCHAAFAFTSLTHLEHHLQLLAAQTGYVCTTKMYIKFLNSPKIDSTYLCHSTQRKKWFLSPGEKMCPILILIDHLKGHYLEIPGTKRESKNRRGGWEPVKDGGEKASLRTPGLLAGAAQWGTPLPATPPLPPTGGWPTSQATSGQIEDCGAARPRTTKVGAEAMDESMALGLSEARVQTVFIPSILSLTSSPHSDRCNT